MQTGNPRVGRYGQHADRDHPLLICVKKFAIVYVGLIISSYIDIVIIRLINKALYYTTQCYIDV